MSRLDLILSNFDSDLLKSLKWQYFLNVGIGILGACFLIALGRLLGPTSFGTYTLCAALPAVAVVLLDCRLQEFVLYAKENSEEAYFPSLFASLLWFDAAAKLLAAALSIGAFLFLEHRGYQGIYLEAVLLSIALVFVSKCLSGPAMGLLRSCGKLEYFSTAQVLDWAFRLLALGLLALTGRVSIANVLATQIVIGGLVNVIVVRRALLELKLSFRQFVEGPRGLPRLLKENAKLIFANQGISATESVVKELDVIVSGIFLTTAQVGTYKLAKGMAGIVWRLADPIFIVIMPKLAKLHSNGQMDELNAFLRALMLILAPGAALLFGASVVGILLVGPLLLGPEYSEAVQLYPLAAMWIVIALPLIWTHSVSVASGKPVIQFLGSGLGNGIGLLAIWLGSWQLGLEGAMIGMSLAYCLPFVFAFVLLRRLRIVR